MAKHIFSPTFFVISGQKKVFFSFKKLTERQSVKFLVKSHPIAARTHSNFAPGALAVTMVGSAVFGNGFYGLLATFLVVTMVGNEGFGNCFPVS
jgi:hypothetical protein